MLCFLSSREHLMILVPCVHGCASAMAGGIVCPHYPHTSSQWHFTARLADVTTTSPHARRERNRSKSSSASEADFHGTELDPDVIVRELCRNQPNLPLQIRRPLDEAHSRLLSPELHMSFSCRPMQVRHSCISGTCGDSPGS